MERDDIQVGGEGKEQSKVIILVGGPTTGTRFRPLTFDVPKPLVPLAGIPLIAHHINSCSQLISRGLIEVILIGFFKDDVFRDFCMDASAKLGVPVVYLTEPYHLGTAGGFAFFRDSIISGFDDVDSESNTLFVIHGDVLCPFPLVEMLNSHRTRANATGSILGHSVSESDVHHYGCLVCDKKTDEVVHYVEKPSAQQVPSNIVNCGVYLFSLKKFYKHLEEIQIAHSKNDDLEDDISSLSLPLSASPCRLPSGMPDRPPSAVRIKMEQEVLPTLAEAGQLFVHHFKDWWVPIKHPESVTCDLTCLTTAAALDCSYHLMLSPPSSYVVPFQVPFVSKAQNPNVIGNVYIHPSAKVHPSARIGPNVSICENVVIGAGVRISNSIIFPNTELKDRCCVLYAIICGDSSIGKWARIEGLPKGDGITVIGRNVEVSREILLRSVIVLPHKSVTESTESKIIL